MNINSFLESLANNSSRNFKIEQLNAQSDNETLREVVRLALDPFTQFYQRKIPQYVTDSKQTSLENALGALYDLSSRTVQMDCITCRDTQQSIHSKLYWQWIHQHHISDLSE